MSNQPFDREVWNLRERPLSSDNNLEAAYADQGLREVVRNLLMRRNSVYDGTNTPVSGFVGSGFTVKATGPASMAVRVTPGLGFYDDPADLPSAIGTVVGVNDLSACKPLSLTAEETIAVPAADPGNPRIDIVEVRVDRRLQDPTSRDVLDPGTGVFNPNVVNKTLSFNLNGRSSVNGSTGIVYKTGTPAGVPVAPAVDAGYVKIAEVLVGAAVASIAQNKISDLRKLVWPGGGGSGQLQIVTPFGGALSVLSTLPPGIVSVVQYDNNIGTNPNNQAFLYTVAAGMSDVNKVGIAVTLPSPGGGIVTGPSYDLIAATVSAPIQTVAAGFGVEWAVGQPMFQTILQPLNSDGSVPTGATYSVDYRFGN